mmetsp:Transcript_8562/g.13257  ORF Transcript_8562/g.13257 Transcript_8562/m.13257 type:complete len:297 (+) Transcript_8562:68-958(+)
MGAHHPHTVEVLAYLQEIKPSDGWSTPLSSNGKVRLLRRGVPVNDAGFLFLFHDVRARYIVGVTSVQRDVIGRGVVLVDGSGNVSREPRDVRVTLPASSNFRASSSSSSSNPRTTSTSSFMGSNAPVGGSSPTLATPLNTPSMSPEDQMQLLKYGLMLLGLIVVLKVIFAAMFSIYILLLPGLFIYAVQTCPSDDSFEAKKELKRVLRGHHLPDDHPSKPKDWLSRTIARVSATVATELATGLGYEISMQNYFGALTIAWVGVPTAKEEFYWVGIFGKWRYVLQRNTDEDGKNKRD